MFSWTFCPPKTENTSAKLHNNVIMAEKKNKFPAKNSSQVFFSHCRKKFQKFYDFYLCDAGTDSGVNVEIELCGLFYSE